MQLNTELIQLPDVCLLKSKKNVLFHCLEQIINNSLQAYDNKNQKMEEERNTRSAPLTRRGGVEMAEVALGDGADIAVLRPVLWRLVGIHDGGEHGHHAEGRGALVTAACGPGHAS